ncbi:hypothetical protein [Burkholderia paludis]|uniref:hypothetical protein n=1 Tax=Burkholderia paludis TaxID=1506587 RepID=UPI001269EB34|nr:hypothetical protein [Burkholderia paludis]
MIRGDVEARIQFLPSQEGGRQGRTPERVFGCPLRIDGVNAYFDCRLLLDQHGAIAPGDTVIVPIKFLCPDLIKKYLHPGVLFSLWERRTIAKGEILKVIADVDE